MPDPGRGASEQLPVRAKGLALGTLLLILGFSLPLYHLLRFALDSELYSYVLLIPFIVGYLGWIRRKSFAFSKPAPGAAGALGAMALLLLAIYFGVIKPGSALTETDRLCLITLSFVLLLLAQCAVFLGISFLRSALFPLLFLFFVVPLPSMLEHPLEAFLQHRSADAAYLLIKLCGTPIFRQDTLFVMPGLSLQVAPECSGIRSSIVLFLTALLAAQLLLRKRWTKVCLVLAVIPLGIFRNAIRIFTLAQLSIHVDPGFIDSPLHHRGGPIFFAVSLVPLFLIVWWLVKCDRRPTPPKSQAKQT